MINISKWMFALLACISLLGAAVLEFDLEIPDPVFIQKEGHMLIDFPGCMQIGIEGEPLRPHFPISYALPPGETLDKIELVIERSKTYPLMLPLLPKQADRPLSLGNVENGFIKNEAVYAKNEYAVEQYRAKVQWYKGVAIVMGTITPSTYYPASGQIEIAGSAKLKITTKSTSRKMLLDKEDIKLLTDLVQNPQVLSMYQTETDQKEKLLIITSNEFKSAFNLLQEHYKKYGIESQVMRVSDILLADVPGDDTQDKIRNKIKELYLNEGLDYVLLGGNSDHVPYRGLSCQVLSEGQWISSNDIPADLYYVALDGTWDLDEDGIFGEYDGTTGIDEADLLPELAIGRMPAATLSELQNMITKSIRYQYDPVIDELDRHTFFGEKLYEPPGGEWVSWGSDYLELLIDRRDDNGYITKGLPLDLEITKIYDRYLNPWWDFSTVKQELAKGTSFIHHDGHCNYTEMMKFSTWEINDSDFVSVNGIDHTLPVLYSHGCNCGGFDRPNCIGSRLVTSPYITVGGVLNSRYGWFNEGQTEGPSIHLHREFEHAIYGMGIDPFGWALNVSKLRTAPWVTAPDQHEQNALRWNYYCQNILGDPVMRIYSDVPIDPVVYYDAIINDSENATVGVYVMTPDQDPIEDAGVAALDSNGLLVGFKKTDASGYAEIELPASIDEGKSIHCYITGHNIIPADSLLTVRLVSNIPVSYTTPHIYPNPFNPNTTIEYSMPYQTSVDIRLYDIHGKFIKIIYSGSQVAGTHKIAFKSENLASGIYICRIQIDDFVLNKKMTLLK